MADYVTAVEVGYFAHEFAALNEFGQSLLVASASRLFDNLCEVADNFFAVGDISIPIAYTDRDLYGNGTGYLQLDPYIELNPVDPIVIEPAHVYEIPDYRETNGMLVVTGSQAEWIEGVKVTVSANWGFLAIPQDVQLAVIHIALHLWRTGDPAFATISNAEGSASRPITLPQIAQTIVDKYREKYSRRALFA